MALKDWVRNDGYVDSYPLPSPSYRNDEEFIIYILY